MKVILDVQSVCTPVLTGIQWYTVNIVSSLLKRSKLNYTLTFFDKDRERNNREKYIEKFFGKYMPALHECNSYSYKDILMSNDESVFSHLSYNDYVGTAGDIFHFMLPLWLPEKLKGQMVVTVHDLIAALYPEKSLSNDNTINCITGFNLIKKKKPICITASEATKADICNNSDILPENVFIIPDAYNPEAFYPQEDKEILNEIGATHPYILFTGTVDDPRKCVCNLIAAFEYIADKHDDLQLVLAGDYGRWRGSSKIKEHISKSKHKNRILLTGYIPVKHIRVLMSGARVFVYPSEYEGFGLPVLEAMACGAPVITSDTSSLPEVAGEAAILIDPADAGQLAYEMERVLTSEPLRKELIAKGFENCKRFSWDKTAEMTEQVYDIAAKV